MRDLDAPKMEMSSAVYSPDQSASVRVFSTSFRSEVGVTQVLAATESVGVPLVAFNEIRTPVVCEWLSPRTLLVAYPEDALPLEAKSLFGEVAVQYLPVSRDQLGALQWEDAPDDDDDLD